MSEPEREVGPWDMARRCEERIAALEAEKARVPRSERRPINQQLHALRDLLRFCKTRAGYVQSTE